MNAEPALVGRTSLSLKLRRNCTAHDTSEPKVAVAIMHGLVVVAVLDATLVVAVVVVGVGMISISDVEPVSVPAVPVTPMTVVPAGAAVETARLSTDVTLFPAGGVTGLVLKMPVTPDGSVGTARVIGELKPSMDCTVMMVAPTAPGLMVSVPGLADMVNDAAVVGEVDVVVVVVVTGTLNGNVAESDGPKFDVAVTVYAPDAPEATVKPPESVPPKSEHEAEAKRLGGFAVIRQKGPPRKFEPEATTGVPGRP